MLPLLGSLLRIRLLLAAPCCLLNAAILGVVGALPPLPLPLALLGLDLLELLSPLLRLDGTRLPVLSGGLCSPTLVLVPALVFEDVRDGGLDSPVVVIALDEQILDFRLAEIVRL